MMSLEFIHFTDTKTEEEKGEGVVKRKPKAKLKQMPFPTLLLTTQ